MRKILLFLILIGSLPAQGQDKSYARRIVNDLCSNEMAGRGYVDNGVNKAASYIAKEFRKLKIKKFKNSYFQTFHFPINTFPTPIKCMLDSVELKVGRDFLLAPDSGPCNGTYKLYHFDLQDSIEAALYEKKKELGLSSTEAFVLAGTNREFEYKGARPFIKNLNKKLIHSLSPRGSNQCKLIFHDSIIDNADFLQIKAQNEEKKMFSSKNVIGYIPAFKRKNRNKYIVFTGHYDHLGKMGNAIFPGASDNASGTAMVIDMARHFSKKKNKYSIVFILFAGEEVGLIGSDYFTSFPTFEINNIQTLINLDIMGSADGGIVAVNATEFPKQFATLTRINKKKNYLPEVRKRGPTQNSDHYHFYKKGIPSFFMYSIGGPGFYHDIMDTPESIPMTNYENVFRLLADFVETF